MIVKVENNIMFKNKNPFEIKRNNTQIKNIKQYWKEFAKDNKDIFNGNVYCVSDITKQKNETIFELAKTKFADVVYTKTHFDLKTRCLFVGTYFITVDGYYCIIKNNRNVINLVGGMADDVDFENDSFNPLKCLYREVKEELGLDIHKSQNIKKINLKYLKVPSSQEDNLSYYPIGLIYETILKITFNEFKRQFNNNKAIIDGEIKEIILLKDFNILEHYDKKTSYLIELFDFVKNEKVY